MVPGSDRPQEWGEKASEGIGAKDSGCIGREEYLEEDFDESPPGTEASEEMGRGTELMDKHNLGGANAINIGNIGPGKAGIDGRMNISPQVSSAEKEGTKHMGKEAAYVIDLSRATLGGDAGTVGRVIMDKALDKEDKANDKKGTK